MKVARPIVGEAKEILDRFVEKIAHEHGVTVHQIMVAKSDRHPAASRARFHAWAVVKWSTGLSFPEIGAFFGVDHTSVLAGVRRWEAILNGETADTNGRYKPRLALTTLALAPEEPPTGGASVVRLRGSG